jgi:molybdenum cofactor cytidylyltransferase
MPQIPASLPTALIRAIGCRAAAAPVHQAQRGHPVLLAARLFPEIMKLSGDRGARSILDTLGDDIALVAVDDAGVLFDVDFRSDIASCA